MDDHIRSFPERVRDHYVQLGYRCSAPEPVGPSSSVQAPFAFSAVMGIPGADDVRVMVLAKGGHAFDQLTAVLPAAVSLASERRCHSLSLVSEGSLPSEMNEQGGAGTPVRYVSIQMLVDGLLNCSAAFNQYLHDYEDSELFHHYVPVGARGSFRSGIDSDADITDIEKGLVDQLLAGGGGLTTILADFGAGKTTLLKRIKYQFCDRYRRGVTTLKPVLFRANELYKFDNIPDYVAHTIGVEFGRKVDRDFAMQFIQQGQFLNLIDGFDEVSQQADTARRRHFFAMLSVLFNSPCPTLMTCRPAFFIEDNEYEGLIEEFVSGTGARTPDKSTQVKQLTQAMSATFRKPTDVKPIRNIRVGAFTLLKFSPDQVDLYLSRLDARFRDAWGVDHHHVRNFVYKVYDIKDLITRPILLEMTCTAILAKRINITKTDETLTAAHVYEAYIDALLDREEERETRRFLLSATRQQLIEAVADAMFERGVLDLDFATLEAAIAEAREALGPELAEKASSDIASDIALVGFLTRDGAGVFRFAHKSFFEYMAARCFIRHLKSPALDARTLHLVLPADIVYFVGAILGAKPGQLDLALRRLEECGDGDERQILRDNLLRSILSTGGAIEGLHAKAATVDDMQARSAALSHAKLSQISFPQSKLESLSLVRCNADRLTFVGGAPAIEILDKSKIEMIVSDGVKDARIRATGSDVELVAQPCGLALLETTDSTLAITGSLAVEQAAFLRSRVVGPDATMHAASFTIDSCQSVSLGKLAARHIKVTNKSVLELGQIPFDAERKSLSARLELRGERPGPWFEMTDSTLLVRAMATSPILAAEIAGWRLENCDVIGLTLESAAMESKSFRDCRGIIFSIGERTRKRQTLRANQGGFHVIDRDAFWADKPFRDEVLKLAAELYGEPAAVVLADRRH